MSSVPPVPPKPPINPEDLPEKMPVGEITINGKSYTVNVIFKNDRGETLGIPEHFEGVETLEQMYHVQDKIKNLTETYESEIGDKTITKITSEGIHYESENDNPGVIEMNKTVTYANQEFNDKELYTDVQKTLMEHFLHGVTDEIVLNLSVNTGFKLPKNRLAMRLAQTIKTGNKEAELSIWKELAAEINRTGSVGKLKENTKQQLIEFLKNLKDPNNNNTYYDSAISSDDLFKDDTIDYMLADVVDRRILDLSDTPKVEERPKFGYKSAEPKVKESFFNTIQEAATNLFVPISKDTPPDSKNLIDL